ncbi:hypothetical protein P8452_43152 [Trifolium repens]|nr:hypothetical protein P8452_43152 [Trifolium repens]
MICLRKDISGTTPLLLCSWIGSKSGHWKKDFLSKKKKVAEGFHIRSSCNEYHVCFISYDHRLISQKLQKYRPDMS